MKQRSVRYLYCMMLLMIIMSCQSKLEKQENVSVAPSPPTHTETENEIIENIQHDINHSTMALEAIQYVVDADDSEKMSVYFSPALRVHKDTQILNSKELAVMVASNMNKQITREIGRVISEGNRVGVHSRRLVNNESYIMADYFEFEHGKISEYWIFMQKEIKPDSPESISKMDMLASYHKDVLEVGEEQIQRNKNIVKLYMVDVLQNGNMSIIHSLFGDTFVQRTPRLPTGKRKFIKMIHSIKRLPNEVKSVVAQGDYVWLHTSYPTYNLEVVDIFRVRDNKIVEHWDVLNDNTMVILE